AGALVQIGQVEGMHVRDEVGIPHSPVIAPQQPALATEVASLAAETIAELVAIVEQEVRAVEQSDDGWSVRYGSISGRLIAAAIEVLVGGIQRDGEDAAWPPLESLLAIVLVPHAG